jgi:hypothetical protein
MGIESGGVFRGASFDMTKDAVYGYETERSTTSVCQDDPNEFVITRDMGSDILNFADVTYKFDEEGLYHIKLKLMLPMRERQNNYTRKLKAFILENRVQELLLKMVT